MIMKVEEEEDQEEVEIKKKLIINNHLLTNPIKIHRIKEQEGNEEEVGQKVLKIKKKYFTTISKINQTFIPFLETYYKIEQYKN